MTPICPCRVSLNFKMLTHQTSASATAWRNKPPSKASYRHTENRQSDIDTLTCSEVLPAHLPSRAREIMHERGWKPVVGQSRDNNTSVHQQARPVRLCVYVCVFIGFSSEPCQSFWSGYGGIKDKRRGESPAAFYNLCTGCVQDSVSGHRWGVRDVQVDRVRLHHICMNSQKKNTKQENIKALFSLLYANVVAVVVPIAPAFQSVWASFCFLSCH